MLFSVRRLIFLLNVMGIITAPAPAVGAGTEGPNSPSSASGVNWKNPTNVFYSDNLRVNYNSPFQNFLVTTSFGFSAVAGTVDGIMVEIEGYGTGTNPPYGDQIDIALSKDGSNPAGSWKTAVALPNGVANEAYISRGGGADLWGTSWIASDIRNSSFGVLVRDTDMNACSFYIDHVRVTVYYTLNATPGRRLKLQKILSGD